MTDIPNEYLCPITLEIMNDPVICNDGYTYERNSILNISNNISPITRENIDLNNLIPNRNLKNAIERYKLLDNKNNIKKSFYMSKLEKFEYEQKIKNQELQDKLKREKIEKEKRDKDEIIRKQNERLIEIEENKKLNRIINMFNSQVIGVFNYGGIKLSRNGMNQFENTTYQLISKGEKKYKFTIDIIKHIKNTNKDIITEKYNKLMKDYLFVKKYVIGKDSNPFVEFVFDEFIPNMDNYLEEELKFIQNENNTLSWMRNCGISYNYVIRDKEITINNISEKVNFIKETKNKKLKTKEYYIVNYEEFCKEFNVKEINYDVLNKGWNILQHWIKTKQKIFNILIQNIYDIYDKEKDKNNFVKVENIERGSISYNKTTPEIHILEGYKNYVESSTQCFYSSRDYGIGIHYKDLNTDYEVKYFEPIIDLIKNIIELIDFIQEEY
jgi:hypothetical protein